MQNIQNEILEILARVAKYISFLLGHAFAGIRKMGEFASSLVDSVLEGFTFASMEWQNHE